MCRQLRHEIEHRFLPQPSLLCRTAHSFNPLTPRSVATRFARLRTEESLEIGIARRRVGLDQSMACRFCSTELHPRDVPASPERRCKTFRFSDPQSCPHSSCRGRRPLANVNSLRQHWARTHSPEPLPARFQPNVVDPRYPRPVPKQPTRPVRGKTFSDGTIQCPFCELHVRPGHLMKCKFRQPGCSAQTLFPCPHCRKMKPAQHVARCSSKPPQIPPTTPARLQPTAQDETLIHVIFECPMLRSLRQSRLSWATSIPPNERAPALTRRLSNEDESILHFLDQLTAVRVK